ncbi:hypothetical protein [Castellaniella sp. S9]|uniref:hypothetical protein n=1 Tax=Castellaniella sp. S9 TaxID=2993652 RepID=UPI0022B33FCC|nr:hypothetical protein [Castellaniella sp. S9]
MIISLLPAGLIAPKLHAVDMDWPPPPPSPFDETERTRRRIEHRNHFLKLMKEKFPGLPY